MDEQIKHIGGMVFWGVFIIRWAIEWHSHQSIGMEEGPVSYLFLICFFIFFSHHYFSLYD